MGNEKDAKSVNPDEMVVDQEDTEILEPGVNVADTDTDTANKLDTDTADKDTKAADTDTDIADTDTDTADKPKEPVDPHQKRFDELGLGSQYANPAEVLERIPDTNRYLDQLEKSSKQQQAEIDRLRLIEQQQLKPKPTAEQLAERMDTDPVGAMADAGFVRTESVQQMQTKINQMEYRQRLTEMASTLGQYPELESIASAYRLGRAPARGVNQFWDAMNDELAQLPGLETASVEAMCAVLHPRVKARLAAKPPVKKVPESKKVDATTTGGSSRPVAPDQPDFSTMSADEIYAYYQKAGMVGT